MDVDGPHGIPTAPCMEIALAHANPKPPTMNPLKPMEIEQALGHTICASLLLRHFVPYMFYVKARPLFPDLSASPKESAGDTGGKSGASCVGCFQGGARGSQGKGPMVFKSHLYFSKCAWICTHTWPIRKGLRCWVSSFLLPTAFRASPLEAEDSCRL